ncbi:ankyrin repeat-containing domain protein [Podospora didyma]|uniref:Ankyrin repeat-containing domain protein n=1 Tax=Podospora didyma TaxID=330526 RepID=A0AAE0P5V8_9PEZI|nr:ankyrin repeat-containing domain protein [Podospora didyma]
MAYSCRPLTVGELCVAISIEDDDTDLDPSNLVTDPWNVLKLGGSLLAVNHESGRVGFAHGSVPEFLLAEDRSDLESSSGHRFILPAAEANSSIASVCLRYLQFPTVVAQMARTLQKAVGPPYQEGLALHSLSSCLPYDAQTKGTQQEAVGQLYEEQFAFLPYAARFWSVHAQRITVDVAGGAIGDKRQRMETRDHIERFVLNWARAPASPLHRLSRTIFSETLRKALQLGWSPDVRGGLLSSTPLHEASKFGSTVLARLLLDGGASVDSKDTLGRTPLFYASQAGMLPFVELLLDYGAKVNETDRYSTSPLHEASRYGHVSVVKALLSRWPSGGSNLDRAGHTPPSVALQLRTLDTSCAGVLLQSGATILPTDLLVLSNYQLVSLLEAIVRRSHQTLDRADSSHDILSESYMIRDIKLLERLLDLGLLARSDKIDGSNSLCKALRAQPSSLGYTPYINDQTMTLNASRALLLHGAMCLEGIGEPCLHCLPSFYNEEQTLDLVKLILDAGCAIEAENSKGYTPFLRAVRANKLGLASTFLSAGASARLDSFDERLGFLDGFSLNAKDRKGRTILHKLAECPVGNETAAMVNWVMKHGGDPLVTDVEGRNPLSLIIGGWGTPYAQGYLGSKAYDDAVLDMARSMPPGSVKAPLSSLVHQNKSQWSLADSCHYEYMLKELRRVAGNDDCSDDDM